MVQDLDVDRSQGAGITDVNDVEKFRREVIARLELYNLRCEFGAGGSLPGYPNFAFANEVLKSIFSTGVPFNNRLL
jgi:hypothetical protein